jgi:hypothetical protein
MNTRTGPSTKSTLRRKVVALGLALSSACLTTTVHAFNFEGVHKVMLHSRDGAKVELGTVAFTPSAKVGGNILFKLTMDHARMKDYFLSMREFKCIDGKTEVMCHVPYPYAHPGTVSPDNLAWLEHSLMFMFKLPSEFGAKLWNGVYFKLKVVDKTLVGTPQAVDLNLIGAPPAKLDVPPYPAAKRDDIAENARAFNKLTIE